MKVRVFDVKRQVASLEAELDNALRTVVRSGEFILGSNVRTFEREFADRCESAHGIGVANGSDALYLALAACGIGPGDEVIVPSFTFFATAGAVVRTGATPVFCDVELATYLLDPLSLEAAVTPRTKAVIPVHLYGQPVDMDALMAVARRHNLKVIEDVAQATGARWGGRQVGTFGTASCYSFFPTKNLGAFGDAGVVLTDDTAIAETVKQLRAHGAKVKYHHEMVGINSRLDEIQAAILRVKLPHLERWNEGRIGIAKRYGELFQQAGLIGLISLPVTPAKARHVFHQYTIRVPQRDNLRAYLSENGIETAVYYPVPLHRQGAFKELMPAECPNADAASASVLSLPMFPELTAEEQEYVVAKVASFYSGK